MMSTSAQADVDDFTFSSFDADYTLSRADDGSSRLTTVETIVAEFPDADQNRGIVRAIPARFDGADLDPQVLSVTDGDGDDVPYERESNGEFVELALGTDEFVRGTQTYVITYEQRNVIAAYDDTKADEFMPDVNGTGWAQPFERVSATLHLEADLAERLTGSSACYSGGEGSTARCEIDVSPEGDGVSISGSTGALGPGENMTIAIGFDRGTFTEPPRPRDSALVTAIPASLLGAGGVVAVIAFVGRRTRWRDAAGRGTIVARYTPPEGLDPMRAAALVDRGAAAIPAQLLQFAVRGNVRVHDAGESASRAYSLEFVHDRDLDDLELEAAHVLFGSAPAPGDRVTIGAEAPGIGDGLRAVAGRAALDVTERGWRRPFPSGPRTAIWLAAGILALLAVVAFFVIGVLGAMSATVALLLVGALGLAVLAFVPVSRAMLVTDSGAELRDHLLGLRAYIELAEQDRLRVLQSVEGAERDDAGLVDLAERLLPWAALWGLERSWIAVLDDLYARTGRQATWSDSGMNAAVLYGVLAAQSTATSTPTWSSSGGSSGFGGSTGGGFSGGGFGGGGGGGR